jgi:hypothetical protein
MLRASIENPTASPTVFISYSWDDQEHRLWVRQLATRLRQDGVDVTLDQWHAAPGDQLPAFMARSIRTNDFVLIICTPNYKSRADNEHGGVAYEGDIIQGEVFIARDHRKFIPVLWRGAWEQSAPTSLLGKYYIDLRESGAYEDDYRELLSTLLGQRDKPPYLGPSDAPSSALSLPPNDASPPVASLRDLVFISSDKTDRLFPQIPTKYVEKVRIKLQSH